MINNKKKAFGLNLTDAQKKIVKDSIGVDCERLEMPFSKAETLTSKSELERDPQSKKMYFTEEQKKKIEVDFEITPPDYIIVQPNPGYSMYAVPDTPAPYEPTPHPDKPTPHSDKPNLK